MDDVKQDMTSNDEKKIEDLKEKTSTRSGELEAQQVDYDEKEAQRVLRKVDLRLVPMLSLLYLVAFIDRSNSKPPVDLLFFWRILNGMLTASSRKC